MISCRVKNQFEIEKKITPAASAKERLDEAVIVVQCFILCRLL